MLVRILSLPALFLALTAAHAGTKLETVNRDLSGGRTMTINTWAQGGMIRVETQPNESAMIFKNDTIYAINHKDKSYIVMDRASMKRMAEQINPALQMLQERMKTMTPEQRAQMQKMLGGHLPGEPGEPEKKQEIKRTSRNDKINGYGCTFVEVREAGALTDEVCVSNKLEGANELMAAAKNMAAVMEDMMSSVNAPWMKQMAQKQMQNFEALGGIPVLTRHYVDGKPRNETTLASISSETLAASLFEIPAGYTRKDMMAPR